jgi:hypothetical protein
LAPFPSPDLVVDGELAHRQAGDAPSRLTEDVTGVLAVTVKTTLSQADADENDSDREFVADVFELVADLAAGRANLEEMQVVNFSDRFGRDYSFDLR